MINIRIISTNIGFFVKTIPLVVKLFLFLGFSLSFHYICSFELKFIRKSLILTTIFKNYQTITNYKTERRPHE